MKKNFKAIIVMLIAIYIGLGSLNFANALPDATSPDGYMLPGKTTYKILDLNKSADYFIEWTAWNGTENVNKANLTAKVGTRFTVDLNAFYDSSLYGDFKIGSVSLTNVSNSEMSFIFLLGYMGFSKGFLIPTNDFPGLEASAEMQSHLDFGIFGEFNATVTVINDTNANTVTYDFKQTAGGNQNTTVTYSIKTGVLTYAKTEFGNFWMEIEQSNAIPGFPVYMMVFMLASTVAITMYRINKKNK